MSASNLVQLPVPRPRRWLVTSVQSWEVEAEDGEEALDLVRSTPDLVPDIEILSVEPLDQVAERIARERARLLSGPGDAGP